MRLDRVLVERGVLSDDEARHALESSVDLAGSLVDTILGSGRVSDEELAWHAAEAHGLPVVDLVPSCVDEAEARRLGEPGLRRLEAVPLHALLGERVMAVVDPDAARRRELHQLVGKDTPLQFVVAAREELRATLDRIFSGPDSPGRDSSGRDGAGESVDTAPPPTLDDDGDAVAWFHRALTVAARDGYPTLRLDPTPGGHRLALHRPGELLPCATLDAEDLTPLWETLRALDRPGFDATLATAAGTVRLTVRRVDTDAGESVLVRTGVATRSALDPDAVRTARAALPGGPAVLVAGPDEATRQVLVRALVEGGAGVVVDTAGMVEEALACATPEDAPALEPDILVCRGPVDRARLESCRRVRSLVVVVDAVSARAALAGVPNAARPYVRGACDDREWVEVFPWT